MLNQNTQQQAHTVIALSMYNWRLTRHAEEKRAENVNREILRRQHAN